MSVLKRLPLLVGILLFLALGCSTCSVQFAGDATDYLATPVPTPTPTPTPLPLPTPVGGGGYGSGYCSRVGTWDSSNPFRGWPTSNSSFHNPAFITAYFCDPNYGHTWQHEGVDFAFWAGTPVVATAEALVVSAGWDDQLGNVVTICSGLAAGWCARYAHLATITVAAWVTVHPGEQIGTVGNSGAGAYGAYHLHYDMRKDNEFHDPFPTLYR